MKEVHNSRNVHNTTELAQALMHNKTHLASLATALGGALIIGVFYWFLPEELIIGPKWLLLAIEIPLVLPVIFSLITRRHLPRVTRRILMFTLLAFVTLALITGIALFITKLPTISSSRADFLLRSAGLLWFTNVFVFGLWYWEIDGGGPLKRHESGHKAADFLFPQQANQIDEHWMPHFIDYLFVSFTSATALSPTDTPPLSRTAKLLMMVEAILSLIIIVLLAARAVNILGS